MNFINFLIKILLPFLFSKLTLKMSSSLTMSEYAEILYQNINIKINEEQLIEIIKKNDLKNRILISQYYKATYGSSLSNEILSKVKGDFGICLSQLFLSPLEFCIYHIQKGLEKSNEITIEQLTSKTVEELKLIEDIYNKLIKKDLKMDIIKAYKGAIGKNILNLWEIKRKYNIKPDKKECEKYADILSKNIPENWVENENIFKDIFIQRSPDELILIGRYYLKITGRNLINEIENKTEGSIRTLLKETLYNNLMPSELFSDKLYLSMKGAGADEDSLSRILISRYELDMSDIRNIYKNKYNSNLKDDIISYTSGFYQKLCLYLSEK